MSGPMTKTERTELAALARRRAKLARQEVDERAALMLAEVEARLATVESLQDAAWHEVADEAKRAIAELNERVALVAAARGIPDEMHPRAALAWSGRGTATEKERRAELRRTAEARVKAAALAAKRRIDTQAVEVETELVREGITSERAAAFLDALPTAADLMEGVTLPEVPDAVEWRPDAHALGELLTMGASRTNLDKRRAVLAALAANPSASNREVARVVGVDPKTVARVREEVPRAGEEVPHDSGEVGA